MRGYGGASALGGTCTHWGMGTGITSAPRDHATQAPDLGLGTQVSMFPGTSQQAPRRCGLASSLPGTPGAHRRYPSAGTPRGNPSPVALWAHSHTLSLLDLCLPPHGSCQC